MKKEHTLVAIIGMFLLAYLLEAVTNPLPIKLASPYEYLNPTIINKYPFTTAVVAIRSLAILLTPLLFASLIKHKYANKAISILILAVLIQLYAVQDVVSGTHLVTLEWALSLAFGGALLFIPVIIYFLKGSAHSVHQKLKNAANPYGLEDNTNQAPSIIED